MGKFKDIVRYHIVSVRVSDEERETLDRISVESDKSVSELMREALQHIVLPMRQLS